MITVPIPIAQKLNSEAKPGRHTPDETPFIQNGRLEAGVFIKSMGWSTVLEKTSIIDGHKIAKNKWLIIAADTAGAAHADIYYWDTVTFTKLTLPTGFDFETGYSDTTGRYADVHFEEIYDTRILIDADNDAADDDTVAPCVVTVITNGACTPLMFRHNATLPAGLYRLPSSAIDSGSLQKGAKLKAQKLAALKDVLYWGNLTSYDTAATQKEFDHRVIWSVVKNIGWYNAWDQYFDFTQGGDKVTGLKAVANNMYITRENSVWVTAGGYGVFDRTGAPGGSTSPKSLMEYFGTLIYDSYGKIIALNSQTPFLSEQIHTMFSGEGAHEYVCGIPDQYSKKIYFSTGQKLFVYDFKYGTWGVDQFEEPVKVIGIIETGSLSAGAWSDPPALHDTLSVVEEGILCDPVIIVGGNKLCKSNHFYRNMPVPPADAGSDPSPLWDAWAASGGTAYETVYEVPLMPLTADLGYCMIRGLLIEGEHTGTIQVQCFFSDSIKKPVWGAVKNITLNTNGSAQLDIYSGRTKYAAFRLSTNDQSSFKLSYLGLLMTRGGRR